MRAIVSIGTGADRVECVRNAFEHLGGIQKWVKPGYRVLLKPNLMTALGPPAITHIDLLKGLYIILKDAGAREVWVGENSVCGMPPRVHFEMMGYTRALEHLGMKVRFFDEEEWVYRRNDSNFCLKDFHVPRAVDEADVWITCPVAKTHEACLTTLGLKNSHGILPDEDKARHHRGRHHASSSLWEKFVDIYAGEKPDLCVCDMYHAMEGQGPAFGDIVEMKLVVASDDTVACDAAVEALMGFENLEGPLTRIAHKRGLGVGDIDQIDIVGERVEAHRRAFKRAVWHPDETRSEAVEILSGDVCQGGCNMILRYLVDTSRILLSKDDKEFGKIYVLCGMNPPPPPEDKFVVCFGDCAIYSTYHMDYRQKAKKIGPWWNTRPGYIDVEGCVPLQLTWLLRIAKLMKGYSPGFSLTGALEIFESEEPSFGTGVPLDRNPRRWHWDPEFKRMYQKEIAESQPPEYIYAANEGLKADPQNRGAKDLEERAQKDRAKAEC